MIMILINRFSDTIYMYICHCNALTEKQVDTAVLGGAKLWPDVYAFYDCEPQCGKCIPQICERLNVSDKASKLGNIKVILPEILEY